MSYEYIAGFFDADGSVGLSSGYPFVSFCQAVQYDDVLHEIARFLKAGGIECGVYAVTPRPTQFAVNHKMTILKVNSIDNMVLILNRMLPFLRVKKERAEKVLAHIQVSDFKTAKRREPLIIAAVQDYLSGMGLVDASTKNRIAWTTLRKHLIANGIHVRTKSESKTLWWSKRPQSDQQKSRQQLVGYQHSHLQRNPLGQFEKIT